MAQRVRDQLRDFRRRSDDELLRIIRSETSSAREKDGATRILLSKCHQAIFLTAWRIVGDPQVAEENVTWIFWTSVLKYEFDRPDRNFNAYVARVSRNEALAHLKYQQRFEFHDNMELFPAPSGPERDPLMYGRIERLLRSFPGNYLEDFIARHVLDMTWSDIQPDKRKQSNHRVRDYRNRKRMSRILSAEGTVPDRRRRLK